MIHPVALSAAGCAVTSLGPLPLCNAVIWSREDTGQTPIDRTEGGGTPKCIEDEDSVAASFRRRTCTHHSPVRPVRPAWVSIFFFPSLNVEAKSREHCCGMSEQNGSVTRFVGQWRCRTSRLRAAALALRSTASGTFDAHPQQRQTR